MSEETPASGSYFFQVIAMILLAWHPQNYAFHLPWTPEHGLSIMLTLHLHLTYLKFLVKMNYYYSYSMYERWLKPDLNVNNFF